MAEPTQPIRKAMISSTARDLPEHRKQVEYACSRMGVFAEKMMENLTAEDANAVEVSLRLVEEADLYIGIFAHRYGFVPNYDNPTHISITEMEYNRAVERGIPRLIFLMHDVHVLNISDVETGRGVAKLKALKKRMGNERVVAFFKSPEDLRAHVIQALTQLERLFTTQESDENTDLEALGLTAVTPNFLESEKNKPGKNCTPENFYLNKSGTQFWGLMNGLVAPRAITSTIFQHLEAALPEAPYLQQPVLAIIAGSGGMGKSVLLRQIAEHFADKYPVWFLEREELEDFDFDQSLDNLADRSETQLVCLDNWEPRLPFKFAKCQKEKFRHVKFVLTAREPQSLNSFIYQGSRGSFNLDTLLTAEEKTTDNLALISLALEKIPAWQTFLDSDKGKTAFAKAKPYQITFILNRLADRQKTAADLPLTDDFQALFENIVDSDLVALQNQPGISGFADALVDFANLQLEFKLNLTKESFLCLADFHNQPKGGDKLYKNFLQKPLGAREWHCLPYYIAAFENQNDILRRIQETILAFHKDDLVEVVATAPQRVATLEKHEVRRRQVIEFLLDDKSQMTPSRLLYQVANFSNDLSDQEKIGWIEKLMEKGNSHRTYVGLLVSRKNALQLPEEKRTALLERFVRLCPDNAGFLRRCLIWLKEREKEKSKRLEFIAALISWGAESAALFCALLANLEGEEQTAKASELIEQSKAPTVLSRCLDILNQHKPELAADKASQLIEESKDFQVLSRCLDILNRHKPELAAAKASELIEQNNHPWVLTSCLGILNRHKPELAAAKASELIDQSNDKEVLCGCLDILNQRDPDLAAAKASELIEQSKDKEVLCGCLDILNQRDPDLAAAKASELIEESKSHEVLCRCLDILNQRKPELAAAKASELMEQSKDHQILCRCLDILGKTAATWSLKKLEKWEKWKSGEFPLVVRCLSAAFPHPIADQILTQIVSKPVANIFLHGKIFMAPFFGNQAWEKRTEAILKNWRSHIPLLVNSCLLSHKEKPELTRLACAGLLENWEALVIKQKKYSPFFTWHVFNALAHPFLRELAREKAEEMVAKGREFCGDLLFNAASKIIGEGVFPGQLGGAGDD